MIVWVAVTNWCCIFMKKNCFFPAVLLLCYQAAGQSNASSNAKARELVAPPIIYFPAPETNHPIPQIALENSDIGQVLSLYAEISARTVLRSPNIEAIAFTLHSTATNRADITKMIEKALADKGIATIPDGNKFVLVVPQTEVAKVKPRSTEIKDPPSNLRERELIPAGAINFPKANLYEVVRIYAELVGRKLDGSESPYLGGPQIRFKSQTALSKEEVLYALDTLFEWRGFRLVPGDGNFLKAIAFLEK